MQEITRKIQNKIQVFKNILKLKFSMKHAVPSYVSFKDFFTYETTARKIGYTFLNNHGPPPNKWIKLNGILLQISMLVLLILEMISFVVSFRNGSINIMIENIMFGGLFVLSLFQIYTIFHQNQTKIIEIVEKLDEHFPHNGVDQLTFDVQKYLRTTKWHETGYYFITKVVILHFSLMPFAHQVYGVFKSTNVEWELILALYLPFDYLQPLIYDLIYTVQLWIIIFVTFYYICTDMIFANLTQVLCMELDILGQIMSEIDPTENEEEATKELKKLVDIHQQLIKVSQKLAEVFSELQLINAFGSIAALCTAIFLVMSGISSYFIAKYFMLPIVITMQILTQCYFSQRLIDSSTSISTSAYNIKWYSGSVKFQQQVLLVMVRAQKPQTITAWKFFDMSLETFQWIINTSYSYFSVLKGTYGL